MQFVDNKTGETVTVFRHHNPQNGPLYITNGIVIWGYISNRETMVFFEGECNKSGPLRWGCPLDLFNKRYTPLDNAAEELLFRLLIS